MNHRGVEYHVLHTHPLDRLSWAVHPIGSKPNLGTAGSRPMAFVAAKQAIDEMIKAQRGDAQAD